jgi:alpha-glucosidase
MLLLTLRGTPTIYYGEEIGMTNVDIPRERQQDPAGLRQPGQERDLCRTPMQWSDEPHAGFAPPETEELWLPLDENWQEVNVEAQLDDPNSLLSLYHRLLAVRKENPALQVGSYQPVDDVPAACFVYRRRGAGQSLMVALNFTGAPQLVPLDQEGTVLLSTHLDREGEDLQNELELRPNEGVIITV